MVALAALWLPILLSAVAVFILSSIIHMGPLWHKSDFPRFADEDRVLDALRPIAIPPGDYMMPRPVTREDWKSASFKEKLRRGPMMVLTVLPPWTGSMAGNFTGWIIYCLVVSALAAYIAGAALPPGASGTQICRFAGTTAFIGYTLALWQLSIWYRRAWSSSLKATLDGIIYAAATGLILTWLWPH